MILCTRGAIFLATRQREEEQEAHRIDHERPDALKENVRGAFKPKDGIRTETKKGVQPLRECHVGKLIQQDQVNQLWTQPNAGDGKVDKEEDRIDRVLPV